MIVLRESEGIYNDLHFVTVFNDLYIRCGYVGVPKEHPLFGKTEFDLPIFGECHGGITYTGAGEHFINSQEESELWWIGFDCNHFGDKRDLETAIKYFPNEINEISALSDFWNSSISVKSSMVKSLEYTIENCKVLIDEINEYTSQIK